MSNAVTIYTDGACKGNPGYGGWGVILIAGETEKELFGGDPETTNNRMEIMAAIQALEALKSPCSVKLFTDSQYLIDGSTKWLHGWKKNGWRTKDKKPVKNDDLWKRLDAQLNIHDVSYTWVRGHDGNHYNERADALAKEGCAEVKGKGLSKPDPVATNTQLSLLNLESQAVQTGSQEAMVTAYTDGSCLKSGAGGWGVVILSGDQEQELSGGEAGTTNNRMEMMAAMSALLSISADQPVKIITDSEYLKKGIEEHIKVWKTRNWRKADGGPVKNLDLWKQLDAMCQNRVVKWGWVKGHSNDKYNDWADRLATTASKSIQDAMRQIKPAEPV